MPKDFKITSLGALTLILLTKYLTIFRKINLTIQKGNCVEILKHKLATLVKFGS